jgi:hypothetical protein
VLVPRGRPRRRSGLPEPLQLADQQLGVLHPVTGQLPQPAQLPTLSLAGDRAQQPLSIDVEARSSSATAPSWTLLIAPPKSAWRRNRSATTNRCR